MNKRQTLCDYFDEDVVVRHTADGRLVLGLVIESSENATDSEDSDSDGDDSEPNKRSAADKWRQLRPGFTKIAIYPKGNTLVINESKVKLYDRSLLSGDIVQRLDPNSHKLVPNSEHGFCRSTRILSTLKVLGTNKVIENVDTNELEMLSHISEDTICLLDAWIGYVKEVNQKITLKCSDGSLLTAYDLDISDFEDLLTQRQNMDSEFNRDDYYIGQQLYGPKKYLKNGKWITQSKQMKRFMASDSSRNSKINVVVEDVSIDSVSINWLCCLSDQNISQNKSQICDTINGLKHNMKNKSFDNSSNATTHPMGDVIRGEAIGRIKCLNYFGKCSLQIGHQCYYTIKSTDSVKTYNDWQLGEALKLFEDQYNKPSLDSSLDQPICVQPNEDNCIERNESSHKKRSISESLSMSSNESNSFKNKKRLKKTKTHFSLSLRKVKKKKLFASHRKTPYLLPIDTTSGSRIPVEIVATNTRVSVVWQTSGTEEDIPSIFLYPVHHIDNHDFFPGDYVVENKDISQSFDYGVVQRCDFISRTATVNWYSMAPDSQTPHFVAQQELSVYDIKDHSDFSFRSGACVVKIPTPDEIDLDPPSRAGQVLDLTLDGMLKCVWVDGTTSLVCPQHLFVVGDYDSDDLWGDSDSEYDYSDYSYYESNTESWETDDENTGTHNSAKKSLKTSSKANGSQLSNSQTLLNLMNTGAAQLEEWIKSGITSVSQKNLLQNLLKAIRRAESNLDKSKENGDSSQKQIQQNSFNKLQQLSKRLVHLLPFFSPNKSNEQLGGDTGNQLTTEPTIASNDSENCSSNSTDLSKTVNELLDGLKTEILKNESQNKSEDTFSPKVGENSKCNAMEENQNLLTNGSVDTNGSQTEGKGNVIFLDSVPECHKYLHSVIEMKNPKEFLKRIKYEISLLKNGLPEGTDVALFHDRIDLLSVLVFGPKGTPYEDGLFLFDIQLPANYPNNPPLVHYISYCSDRLNPNLYESGKVCISLLGTWSGKGTEVWAPNASNLLQLIISIQGLILVAEPYYNEAGYGKQRGTVVANENSRLYNEMVVIKMIQSITKMVSFPPKTFESQIREHILSIGGAFIERNQKWAEISRICISNGITTAEELSQSQSLPKGMVSPPFPLLPASHGFCLSLNKSIQIFKETIDRLK